MTTRTVRALRVSLALALAFALGGAAMGSCVSLDSFVFAGRPATEYRLEYAPEWPESRRVPEDLRQLVTFPAEDGTIVHGLWLARPAAEMRTAPTVVFSHGQGGNLHHSFERASHIWSLGANVLAYDYRGYGLTEGVPTEPGLYMDGRAAVAYVRRLGAAVDQNRVFQYGLSLGGGVATDVASAARGTRGLILESTFTSINALAADGSLAVPRSFVTSASFDNRAKIRRAAQIVPNGVLLFHGDQDDYVQPKYSEELRDEVLIQPPAGRVELVMVAGARHGDVPAVADAQGLLYSETLRAFLFR